MGRAVRMAAQVEGVRWWPRRYGVCLSVMRVLARTRQPSPQYLGSSTWGARTSVFLKLREYRLSVWLSQMYKA